MNDDKLLFEARSLRKKKKFTECIDLLSPFIEEGIIRGSVNADIMRIYSQSLSVSGRGAEARSKYHKAILANRENYVLIARYAEFLAYDGDVSAGLSFIDTLLKHHPSNSDFALSKGIILHRYAGDLDSAAVFMHGFIGSNPDHGNPHLTQELYAVFHKIEKRDGPEVSKAGIWDTLGTRVPASSQMACSAGTKGGFVARLPEPGN